jgi:DNA-binding response OmpR family regulator
LKVVFIGADPRATELATMSFRLRWPDAVALVAASAAEGLVLLERESPEVVIVHPDFTDMALSEVIRNIRLLANVPLLVLGNRGDEMEVVTSLEVGADDYVRLPCDLTELMVRIWALLRRSGMGSTQQSDGPLTCGPLLINPSTYEVFLDNRRIILTSTEFRLLYLLARHRGTVVTRQMLEQNLWGDQVDSYGLVKKYVQRLRRKLGDNAREPTWIASVHGVGYRFIGPGAGAVTSGGSAAKD